MKAVNVRRGPRRRALLGAGLSAALLAAGVLLAPTAAADEQCGQPQRLFAVDAANGHLDEVGYCADTRQMTAPVEVDGGDWRVYRDLTAVRDGSAVVLYSVTTDGHLLWRRQEAPGLAWSAPVAIGPAIDWSQYQSVFAPHAGHLHARLGNSMRTFQHDGWATGAPAVTEIAPLLPMFAGPAMSAARWGGSGEHYDGGVHFRIWARTAYDLVSSTDAWYFSGTLPAGVTGVTGAEPALFGLDATGQLVLLKQDRHPPTPPSKWWNCPLFNDMPWYVQATVLGQFSRVVVPATAPPDPTGSPTLRYASTAIGPDCTPGARPYEWQ